VVRTGALVRSDAPIALEEPGRAVLRELGVRTALDLREPVERKLDPPNFDGLGLTLHHVPIIGKDFELKVSMGLEEIYRDLLEQRGAQLTSAVALLSEPGALPALVFCSAGKDRTGLVIALVLGALGVPDDQIVADFTATERAMEGAFRAVIEARAVAAGISEQEVAIKVGAPPALMRGALAWLRERDGGAAGYLRRNGLGAAELEALRRGLVESRAASAA
jgi:protein-tyrosine phosphatase